MAQDTAFTRGVKALGEGQPRVARVEFMNAIKARPGDPQPHLMQARTYLLLEDGVAAEAEVRRAGSLGAPDKDMAHMLAEALLLQGDATRALAAASAPSRFPAAAYRMQGRAHQALGQEAEAAAAYGAALKLAPRDHRLWVDVARFRLQTGERAGAILAADRALALNPRFLPAILLRGTLVRTQYGLKAALPWFARAAAADPDNIPARIEQAATLGDLGRTREMLAVTRNVLALSPGNAEARYLQAVLAARARNFTLARRLYRRITGPTAGTPGALLLGGVIDLQLGNAEQAVTPLGALLGLQPGNMTARRLLGLAYLRSGDPRRALAVLRPLEGEAVADSYSLTLLAAAYAGAGNRQVAARALARAAGPGGGSSGPGGGSGLLPVDLGGTLGGPAFARAAAVRREIGYGSLWSGIAAARAVAAQSPGAPEAYLIAGDALMLGGSAPGAADAFQKAANLAFTEPAALRLVEALQAAGRLDDARTTLALFLDQHPQSLAGLRLLANLRLAARDWPGAIAAYERIRARTGDHDAVLLNNLAWARYESGDAAEALPAARTAYALSPGNIATADAYGWMLLKTGRERASALALLARAGPAR